MVKGIRMKDSNLAYLKNKPITKIELNTTSVSNL